MKVDLAPSILAGDFSNLKKDLDALKEASINYLHYDVMDGHFVPNISFGASILNNISKKYEFIYDVHLMISEPLKYFQSFVKAGASIITFHYEALNPAAILETIEKIRVEGQVKVGMSIKPGTEVTTILPYLEHLDLILVMSVEPGFGGQAFLESALTKLEIIKDFAESHQLSSLLIEVDGGIDFVTAPRVIKAGANLLVAGSYLVGKEDLKSRVESLRSLAK